jgi:hypothetical protein
MKEAMPFMPAAYALRVALGRLTRRRGLLATALGLLAATNLAVIARSYLRGREFARDFLQDYLIGKALLVGSEPYLTVERLVQEHLPAASRGGGLLFPHPTPHPPSCAVLFAPLARLDYSTAMWVFLSLNILAVTWACVRIPSALGSNRPASDGRLLLLAVAASQPFQDQFL